MDFFAQACYNLLSGFTKNLREQQIRGKRSADPKPFHYGDSQMTYSYTTPFLIPCKVKISGGGL